MPIARGTSQYFPVLIWNDGQGPASFKLKGTGAASGYTVSFFDHRAGKSVTDAVRKGTFSTGTVAPGAAFALRMVVKVSATAAGSGSFVVTASSTAGTPKDVVKGVVRAT